MGMMDFVRSSYNLGEHFTDTRCQTKDIEDGIGGTMTQYWIAPDGVLYWIDYSHTADFVELKEGDEGYSEKAFLNFIWVPNGIRGKVRVHPITKYIEIYPEHWNQSWETWPTCRLHFKYGRLMDYEYMTKR
jgi:hypothetical protein